MSTAPERRSGASGHVHAVAANTSAYKSSGRSGAHYLQLAFAPSARSEHEATICNLPLRHLPAHRTEVTLSR